jgi:autotransporter family porin
MPPTGRILYVSNILGKVMNKIFRVKWNSTLGRFDVTSELTSGKTKSNCGSKRSASHLIRSMGLFSLSALALAMGAPALADDIELQQFISTDRSNTQYISGNSVLKSTDGFKRIDSGKAGFIEMTFAEALSGGILKGDGAPYLGNTLTLGNKVGVDYIDPITHNKTTFQAFDTNQLRSGSLLSTKLSIKENVGDNGQYVDRNLIELQNGSTLDVSIGSTSADWYNQDTNRLLAYLKGSKTDPTFISSIFKVNGNSSLDYKSKTVVQLGNYRENQIDSAQSDVTSFYAGYNGVFESAIGAQNVTDINSLQAYNDALILAVKEGRLESTNYDREFKKAYGSFKYVYAEYSGFENDPIHDDINSDRVAYIIADGENANVNISSGASIQLYASTASLISLANGANLINQGTLGSFNNTSLGSVVIRADNSTITNKGVIDVGTDPDMAKFKRELTDASPIGLVFSTYGPGTGIQALNGSTVINEGIINLAPRQQYNDNTGVQLTSSSLVNTGIINVSATSEPSSYTLAGRVTRGVNLSGPATFTNEGMMYLGRQQQRIAGDATVDIDTKNPGNVLVTVNDRGVFSNKSGADMVIGSKTQGALAVDTTGFNTRATNSGNITINGVATGVAGNAPLQNIGMRAINNAQNTINGSSGTITLNGINAIAMQANTQLYSAPGAAAIVRNEGTINIEAGLDPVTSTANYGLWAQGARSRAVNANTINVKGNGAIGAHARDGGMLEVSSAGSMNFSNGTKQTGYFVFGANSTLLDNSTSAQVASTEDSTMYRIDGGANFDGTGSASAVESSGKNATALLVTSNSQASQLNTGNMTITASGEGATGIKVMGNAQGTLAKETTLSLTGANSTAGIVDGSYSDITGSGDASYRGNAKLISYATLDGSVATAANAIGYIARNGGTLEHRGNINFAAADTTGVLVNGGTLDNIGDIHVNGVAVDIQGANSTVSNTGTIEATDGEAAIKVGSGAHLDLNGNGIVKASGSAHGILLDSGATGLTVKDATIEMNPVGNGNGIENRAEIAGIKLDNTHITVDNGAGVRTAASMDKTNSGTITVNGSGTGLLLQNADGSTATGSVDMSASRELVIDVNSANGKGIVANVAGNVKSGASVNVNNAAGGSALKVTGGTSSVEQSGRLVSQSTLSPVVDVDNGSLTSFINSGDIIANSAAQVAMEITSGLVGVHFTNAEGGNIVGQVNLTTASDHTVDLHKGSTATDVTTAGGNDTFNLVNVEAADTSLFTSLNAGSGTGDTLNLDKSDLTLAASGKTITGFETVNLKNGSTLTLDNILLPLGDAQDDAAGTGFNIDQDSILALKQSADTQFASHISGAGTIAASTGGNAFDFTSNNATNSFTGTLALTDSTFGLDGLNTQALTHATLLAGTNSRVTVADGVQQIGGLNFDGGTVVFDTGTPGDTVAKGVVQTSGLMDISGRGTVEINPGSVTNHHVLPPQTVSLLEQDEGDQGIKLAGSAIPVNGSGGNLELRDTSGNIITDSLNTSVLQDGNVVANATYDYRLTSGQADDGLYVTYGLTQLDLLTQGSDALVLNAFGKSGNAADMSAKLIGTGDLAIDTGAGQTVSLSNMDNNYSGKTDVRSGNLLMNNDNVLGQTSELALAANTGFDMNGYSQTIGALNTAAGSVANFNGGALSITDGGSVDGSLLGSGALNVNGGTLTVNGSNTGLAATTSIASGADVQLNNTRGLGSGNIVNEGLLALKNAAGALFNSLSGAGETDIAQNSDVVLLGDNSDFAGKFSVENASTLTASAQSSLGSADIANEGLLNLTSSDSWLLNNAITGSGQLNQNGSGVVTLSQQAAQYTGDTQVNAGGLQLGSAGNDVTLSSGNLNIAKGAVAGGFGGTAGNVNNSGTLQLGSLNPVSMLAVSDAVRFNVGGNLVNSGDIIVGSAGAAAGNQLHIAGNYSGNNGHITLNTALGDDNSVTDKMIVAGDTSGTTRVSVNNAGGNGAKTINGIEVINVGGKSDGEFVKDGRIVAGAFDYNLVRGEGSNNNNWYLTNVLSGVVDPGDGGDNGDKDDIIKIYRPESAAYSANMAAANNLFNTRLHDRLGETHYVDALTGEEKVTSMWLRNVGGHTRSSDSSGQMKTQANRYVMQMGGDIAQWTTDGANRYHLGVMAGYANQQSNSRNHLSGQKADGSINGYSTGIYATWLQDNEEKSGAYLDSWAQYSWFDNTVKGDSLAAESYKSKGFTASLETGYTWKIGEKNERESYYVQPQAQVTWMGVKADEIREQNGTRVKGTGDGNIQTRLGARAFIKGHNAIDDGKDRVFQPFVEANWIHNTQEFGSELNGVKVSQKGTRNLGELKVGVEGQITKNVNLWGNIGQQMGDKGYSDTSALLGVKVNF